MINIEKEGDDYLLVSLHLKEANLGNADEFKALLIGMFDQHRKTIMLSLAEVEYIDSSFLGALVAALKHVISFKSDIILVSLRKDIADLFSLIRLDKVFKTRSSFADALDKM